MSRTAPRTPSRRLRTAGVVTLLAVLAAGGLAGCGNGVVSSHAGSSTTRSASASATASARPTARPTSASASSSGGGAAATPTPTPTAPAPAGPPICGVADLTVTAEVPAGGGAAGSAYVLLGFLNHSQRTCTLDGHPGVSFVGGGDGHQLGTPADFTGGVQQVSLDPGSSMDALLKVADAGNYDPADCAPTDADGFRVYPPDSRASVFVRFTSLQACQAPLGAGHSQLQVFAVGDAG